MTPEQIARAWRLLGLARIETHWMLVNAAGADTELDYYRD
jgi:hypothetical protein